MVLNKRWRLLSYINCLTVISLKPATTGTSHDVAASFCVHVTAEIESRWPASWLPLLSSHFSCPRPGRWGTRREPKTDLVTSRSHVITSAWVKNLQGRPLVSLYLVYHCRGTWPSRVPVSNFPTRSELVPHEVGHCWFNPLSILLKCILRVFSPKLS